MHGQRHRLEYDDLLYKTPLGVTALTRSKKIYAGFSVWTMDSISTVSLAIRDTTYLLDFIQRDMSAGETGPNHGVITNYILSRLKRFTDEHSEKFMGLAMPQRVATLCPELCSRLWAELDVIPLVLPEERHLLEQKSQRDLPTGVGIESREIGEQAESMGRKCVRLVYATVFADGANCVDCLARITCHCYRSVFKAWWRSTRLSPCVWQAWRTSRTPSHQRHGLLFNIMRLI